MKKISPPPPLLFFYLLNFNSQYYIFRTRLREKKILFSLQEKNWQIRNPIFVSLAHRKFHTQAHKCTLRLCIHTTVWSVKVKGISRKQCLIAVKVRAKRSRKARELSHMSVATTTAASTTPRSSDNYRQLFDTAVGNPIRNRRGDARALNFPPR